MARKAIIIKDKFGNKLYPATYKDDEGNVIKNSYQRKLVSGVNIKTVNDESILGPGNLEINSGVWGNITGDIEDQTDLIEKIDEAPNFIEYPSLVSFPEVGEEDKLYLASDTSKIYKWNDNGSETGEYTEVSPAPEPPDPQGVEVSATAPSNTKILWIDTTSNNGLKYYNGTSWVAVPALFG